MSQPEDYSQPRPLYTETQYNDNVLYDVARNSLSTSDSYSDIMQHFKH